MENNTDKKIADKLKGIEMPYEPEAWQEMEALLDKKKKRRVIFWWFFGSGIAACLLLGGLLWQNIPQAEQHNKASENITAENKVEVKEPVINAQGAITTNENAPVVNGEESKSETTTTTANNENLETAKTNSAKNSSAIAVERYSKKKETAQQGNQKQTAEKVKAVEKKDRAPIAIVTPKQRKLEKVKELVAGTEEQSGQKQKETTPVNLEAKEEVMALNGTAAEENKKAEQANGLTIETVVPQVETTAKTTEEEMPVTAEEKKEEMPESATAKKEEKDGGRKKVFSFHLGARTDFYDVIPLHEGARDTFVKAKGVGRFACMVGPDMEFMFGKHFSIYTGALYSYNSYRVNNPVVDPGALYLPDSVSTYGSIVCKNYISIAHEIVLPLGFKGYPYVSDNFRISIAAGIFNHIKIKEKFNTEVVTTPYTSMNAPLVGEDKFVTTTSNPFTNAYTDMYDNSPTTQALEKRQSQANWFSVSGTSRYYASFYASIGAEVILKKRLRILVEPVYRMSISTIGEQQQRLHSFGGSIGFKYQLGK